MIHCVNCNDWDGDEVDCFYVNWEVGWYNGVLKPDFNSLRYSYVEKEAIVVCDYCEPFNGPEIFLSPRTILKS